MNVGRDRMQQGGKERTKERHRKGESGWSRHCRGYGKPRKINRQSSRSAVNAVVRSFPHGPLRKIETTISRPVISLTAELTLASFDRRCGVVTRVIRREGYAVIYGFDVKAKHAINSFYGTCLVLIEYSLYFSISCSSFTPFLNSAY